MNKEKKKVQDVKTEETKEIKTDDIEVINPLEEENEKLRKEVDRLKNEYAKAYADTENTRKRLNAEAEMNKRYRIQSFALEVLPVIDNLERALAQQVETEEGKNYRKGVEMIYMQLVNALKNEGVEEVDVLDKPFDANFSQAIMTEKKEDVEPNTVIQVLQKGYKLKDRILRAAMVKVSE